ncbi:hypothetical protein [Enterocloster bolteae]|nr:hypothetical protein [Enterocloster bolteae]
MKEIKSILSSRFHTAMRRWRERNFVIKSVKVLEELYINKIRKSKKEGVKMAYAEKTSISVARTKADIEELVQKYGASQFVSGYKDNLAVIGFSMSGRQIKFLLPLPDKSAREYWYTPGRGQRRTEAAAHTAWEQACRSRWRALYLIIKAKLEAVEAGISTVEREFLYDIVLPDGQTAGEWMAPQIAEAYQTGQMPPMLPLLD